MISGSRVKVKQRRLWVKGVVNGRDKGECGYHSVCIMLDESFEGVHT